VYADYRERPSLAVETWAANLLTDLIKQGKLSASILLRYDPRTLKPSAADHRDIARAFCEHFAEGREFKYSLDRPRKDRTIDPCEDFLFNTKAGHCERFATALAMALRGVGIPCQFVLGFRGAELADEGYVVRQSHAHAWVEAIVPSTPVGPTERDKRYVWITLDPTPNDDEDGGGSDGFWDAARKTGKQFLTEYVIGLNPSSQKRAAAAIRETTTSVGPWVVVGLFFVALGVAVVRRLRARVSAPAEVPVAPSAVPWYDRMVGVLTAAGLSTRPGQTPREYAATATAHLSADPRTAAVADTPASVAGVMYEVRYAGVPLDDARLTDLNRAVDELATALSHAERRATP
jgi:protein-glutamine gamma-glutamyltransferase